jgi:hypothetical protein
MICKDNSTVNFITVQHKGFTFDRPYCGSLYNKHFVSWSVPFHLTESFTFLKEDNDTGRQEAQRMNTAVYPLNPIIQGYSKRMMQK